MTQSYAAVRGGRLGRLDARALHSTQPVSGSWSFDVPPKIGPYLDVGRRLTASNPEARHVIGNAEKVTLDLVKGLDDFGEIVGATVHGEAIHRGQKTLY